jgi:histidinol phosphatase-like enzyme
MLSAHINLILNNFNGQPDMQILHKNILQSFNMLTADISSVFYCYNTATACWEAVECSRFGWIRTHFSIM